MFGNVGFQPSGNGVEQIPDVLPGRAFLKKEYQPVSNSRSLDNTLNDEESVAPSQLKDRIRNKITSEENQRVASKPRVTKENKSDISRLVSNLDLSFWKANTTYLLCNDIHQLQIPQLATQNFDKEASPEQNLAFIIPPNFGTVESPEGEEMLLAVTCKVTDVTMLPVAQSRVVLLQLSFSDVFISNMSVLCG